VYFSIRKTTLRYVSPSLDLQTSLVITVSFLIYFFVYLESGGRFQILKIGLKFRYEVEFEFNLEDFVKCFFLKVFRFPLLLEINIYDLKMTMKSGLEFFILKFTKPLQSCCCPVQKNLPRKAELACQVRRYLWRGLVNFKIKKSWPPSFLSQKW
jgi:hypothetical protein